MAKGKPKRASTRSPLWSAKDAADLRRARLERGLTQLDLAVELGVGHRSLKRWEAGPHAVGPRGLNLGAVRRFIDDAK